MFLFFVERKNMTRISRVLLFVRSPLSQHGALIFNIFSLGHPKPSKHMDAISINCSKRSRIYSLWLSHFSWTFNFELSPNSEWKFSQCRFSLALILVKMSWTISWRRSKERGGAHPLLTNISLPPWPLDHGLSETVFLQRFHYRGSQSNRYRLLP